MNKQYNLAIDFGNTLVKAGIFDKENLNKVFSYQSLTKRDISNLFQKFPIKACIISSVITHSLTIERFLLNRLPTVILNEKTPVPIKNRYKTKYALGKDRLSCVVAAWHLFNRKNTLVINCGTCITYDLINNKGEYLGGGISPGLDMRLKALNAFTSKLPLIEKKGRNSLIGSTTESSILNGVINGALLEIEGFINVYKSNFQQLNVILSGGDANYFGSQLKNKIFAVPHMVLTGLNQILLYNDTETI